MDAAQRRTETSLRIDPGFFKLLSQSDARLLGKPLAPEHVLIENAPRWLYDSAPFGLLKHNPPISPDCTVALPCSTSHRRV